VLRTMNNEPSPELEEDDKQQVLFEVKDFKGTEMQELNRLSALLDDMTLFIEDSENKLKEMKEARRRIAEIELPELMNQMQMLDFTMQSGKKVKLNTFYDAKIKDKKVAFDYLEKQGDTAIIKDTITLSFDRGDIEKANEITEDLANKGVALARKEAVHPSTLKAYVKEAIESGANIPMEAFGIYIGNRVTIK